jgi:hypothetical protein
MAENVMYDVYIYIYISVHERVHWSSKLRTSTNFEPLRTNFVPKVHADPTQPSPAQEPRLLHMVKCPDVRCRRCLVFQVRYTASFVVLG